MLYKLIKFSNLFSLIKMISLIDFQNCFDLEKESHSGIVISDNHLKYQANHSRHINCYLSK
jgi:hypothetical protein